MAEVATLTIDLNNSISSVLRKINISGMFSWETLAARIFDYAHRPFPFCEARLDGFAILHAFK